MPKVSLAITMGILRLISGCIELSAGYLIIYFNQVETALKINSLLAIIGPLIMIIVTSLGLIGLAGQISLARMMMILSGVTLIFLGLNKL